MWDRQSSVRFIVDYQPLFSTNPTKKVQAKPKLILFFFCGKTHAPIEIASIRLIPRFHRLYNSSLIDPSRYLTCGLTWLDTQIAQADCLGWSTNWLSLFAFLHSTSPVMTLPRHYWYPTQWSSPVSWWHQNTHPVRHEQVTPACMHTSTDWYLQTTVHNRENTGNQLNSSVFHWQRKGKD